MYRAAYSDYMAARYPLASSEFSDLIKAYPDDNLAGNSYFYLGEIDLRIQKPTDAIKQYDRLLERYPDNNKIPAARLHKGEALIATNKTAAGTVELRALIARYPQSPEAAQAKARLATLRSAAR
jgi:tol-pal system protein YbgF